MDFFSKTKEKAKPKKVTLRKKVALELLHHILGHKCTRSLMAGDTANVWKNVELRIDPDPFFTSCHISLINKKSSPKTPLKPKAPLKWFLMEIIPETSPKSLTSETTFSDYILIVDAYSKYQNFMVWKDLLLRK